MTHALLAAKSGWGKSWFTQLYIEHNLESVDYAVILDFCDEYRGLAKAGMASWMGVGDVEADLTAESWARVIEDNEKIILARQGLRTEVWRDVVAEITEAARGLANEPDAEDDVDVLIVLDEAHFVAPQKEGYPDVIEGIATTGRGEGVSSIWVTQRLSELDETVIAQMMLFILGGFRSKADRDKIAGYIEYNVEVHNVTTSRVPGLPDVLHVDGEPLPVRKFENDAGDTIGSEWVRSDDAGHIERVDTRQKSMQSTHYGNEGHNLENP